VFEKAESATLRNLDPSSLYELARPSTPQSARNEVLGLIADKTVPSLSDVRGIIHDAKSADAPKPKANPITPRRAALQDQFKQAIATLQALSTKPVMTFAGIVPAGELEMLSNYLRQIASATVKPPVKIGPDLSTPDFLRRPADEAAA
jgi:hypothetical protein